MCLCPPGCCTLFWVLLIPQIVAFCIWLLLNQGESVIEYGRSTDGALLVVGAVWVSFIYSLDRCLRFGRRCFACCCNDDIGRMRETEFNRLPREEAGIKSADP